MKAIIALMFFSGVALAEHRSTYGSLQSESMGKTMHFSVYTPPGWTASERLPLVVLLHGAGSDHESFDQYQVGDYLNAEIESGRAPRAVIVNPEGELGFWENWHDGSRLYRDWVMQDLLPVIAENFNTLSCPDNCHVLGFSMGGHGALRFAYFEHESFDSVSVVSALVLSKDEVRKQTRSFFLGLFVPFKKIWGDLDDPSMPRDLDPYVAWLENEDVRALRLLVSWGSKDKRGIVNSSRRFHEHLKSNGLQHTSFVYDGKHKWVDWKVVVADALRFQVWHEAREILPVTVAEQSRGDVSSLQ